MTRRLWLVLFWVAALWNISGGVRMMTGDSYLGGVDRFSTPGFFITLTGLFLVILGAVTFLLVYDQDRFAPLAWFVAAGRLAGSAVIFTYLAVGDVPGSLLVPGIADLLLGLGFLAFAASRPRGAAAQAQVG